MIVQFDNLERIQKRRKSRTISISNNEWLQLKKDAEELGINISELIRKKCFD